MKWKTMTASVVTAAIVSAPVAGAAPANGGGNTGPNEVGQAITQIAGLANGGASPVALLEALNTFKGLLDGLKHSRTHGSGKGAILQQQTLDNVGKTLKQ